MKAEIELTIDSYGDPILAFKHNDRDDSLEQKLLKVFIERGREAGLEIIFTSGYLEAGTKNSHDNYEIHAKRINQENQ